MTSITHGVSLTRTSRCRPLVTVKLVTERLHTSIAGGRNRNPARTALAASKRGFVTRIPLPAAIAVKRRFSSDYHLLVYDRVKRSGISLVLECRISRANRI